MFKPMLDMSWMLAFLIGGIEVLIVAIPFTILIETWLLKRSLLKERSVGRVLLDTLVMNIVSGISGHFFNYTVGFGVCSLVFELLVLHPHVDRYSYTAPLWASVVIWFVMVSLFVLASTFVETPVLVWMERKWWGDIPRKQISAVVLKINFWSNLLVFLIILIFLVSLDDPILPSGMFYLYY